MLGSRILLVCSRSFPQLVISHSQEHFSQSLWSGHLTAVKPKLMLKTTDAADDEDDDDDDDDDAMLLLPPLVLLQKLRGR